jgi:hypothetical protein
MVSVLDPLSKLAKAPAGADLNPLWSSRTRLVIRPYNSMNSNVLKYLFNFVVIRNRV